MCEQTENWAILARGQLIFTASFYFPYRFVEDSKQAAFPEFLSLSQSHVRAKQTMTQTQKHKNRRFFFDCLRSLDMMTLIYRYDLINTQLRNGFVTTGL